MRFGTWVSMESSFTTGLYGHFQFLAQQIHIQTEITSKEVPEMNPSHHGLQPNRENSELTVKSLPLSKHSSLVSSAQCNTGHGKAPKFLHYSGVKGLNSSCSHTVENAQDWMLKVKQHIDPVLLSVPNSLGGLGHNPYFFPWHFAVVHITGAWLGLFPPCPLHCRNKNVWQARNACL